MRATEIPHLAELSTSEKILLVEDLWDSITSDNDAIPIPASHKEELDRRIENHRNSSGKLLSLKELKEHIEQKK